MTYQEQIKHPKWQKKRLEILERDFYTCQSCFDKENQLHVHHFYYDKNKMIWEYQNNTLIVLCESCHNDWHKLKKEIDRMLCITNDELIHIGEIIKAINRLIPPKLSDLHDMIISYMKFNNL